MSGICEIEAFAADIATTTKMRAASHKNPEQFMSYTRANDALKAQAAIQVADRISNNRDRVHALVNGMELPTNVSFNPAQMRINQQITNTNGDLPPQVQQQPVQQPQFQQQQAQQQQPQQLQIQQQEAYQVKANGHNQNILSDVNHKYLNQMNDPNLQMRVNQNGNGINQAMGVKVNNILQDSKQSFGVGSRLNGFGYSGQQQNENGHYVQGHCDGNEAQMVMQQSYGQRQQRDNYGVRQFMQERPEYAQCGYGNMRSFEGRRGFYRDRYYDQGSYGRYERNMEDMRGQRGRGNYEYAPDFGDYCDFQEFGPMYGGRRGGNYSRRRWNPF